MSNYLLKKSLSLVATVFGVSILVFLMVHLIPGDPASAMLGQFATPEAVEQIHEKLGLNQPLLQQYLQFIGDAVRGDLGTSYFTGIPVAEEILSRFPITLQMSVLSLLLSAVVGVLLGVLAAVKKGSGYDVFAMLISLIGISAPTFWIAIFLIWFLAYKWTLFPISGYSGLQSLWLPAITLGLMGAGSIARMTRSSMLEVLNQEYIRTARAKGVRPYGLIFDHALQNAFIPILTMIGLQFGSLLSGAVIVESVFALPGIGNFMIESIIKRDIPTVQGLVLFMTVIFVFVNFVTDLLYGWFNPRIKYE